MIPLREQEAIRSLFERGLEGRVRVDFFTQRPSKLVLPGREECVHCENVRKMLREVAGLSENVVLTVHEFAEERAAAERLGVDRIPGIVVRGILNRPLRFFGVPALNPLIDTIIAASRREPLISRQTARILKKMHRDVDLTVLVVPPCPHSAVVAFMAMRLALASPKVHASVVEIAEFPDLVERYKVDAVPMTIVDGRVALVGELGNDEALAETLVEVSAAEPSPLVVPSRSQVGPATRVEPPSRPSTEEAPALRRTRSGLILPG